MGRILVRGEPGAAIIDACAPAPGEIVVDKPGKGMFYATDVAEILKARGIAQLVFAGVTTEVCVQTSMREANDRGYECLLDRGRDRELLSRLQGSDARDDPGAGRHRRMDDALRGLQKSDRMTDKSFDPEALVDAMAPLLKIALTPAVARRRPLSTSRSRPSRRSFFCRARSATQTSRPRCSGHDAAARRICAGDRDGGQGRRGERGRGDASRARAHRGARRRLRRLHRRRRGARAPEGGRDRRSAGPRGEARAARRRAVRGQEPVRREGSPDPGGLEDQSRPAAGRGGRDARHAARSRRRGADRRAQHGRIRL